MGRVRRTQMPQIIERQRRRAGIPLAPALVVQCNDAVRPLGVAALADVGA